MKSDGIVLVRGNKNNESVYKQKNIVPDHVAIRHGGRSVKRDKTNSLEGRHKKKRVLLASVACTHDDYLTRMEVK